MESPAVSEPIAIMNIPEILQAILDALPPNAAGAFDPQPPLSINQLREAVELLITLQYPSPGMLSIIDPSRIKIAIAGPHNADWAKTYKSYVLDPLVKAGTILGLYVDDPLSRTETAFVATLEPKEFMRLTSDRNALKEKFKMTESLEPIDPLNNKLHAMLQGQKFVIKLLEKYVPVRNEFYTRRHAYFSELLTAELSRLEQQMRFRDYVIEHTESRPNKRYGAEELIQMGYTADPVRALKLRHRDPVEVEQQRSLYERGNQEFLSDAEQNTLYLLETRTLNPFTNPITLEKRELTDRQTLSLKAQHRLKTEKLTHFKQHGAPEKMYFNDFFDLRRREIYDISFQAPIKPWSIGLFLRLLKEMSEMSEVPDWK